MEIKKLLIDALGGLLEKYGTFDSAIDDDSKKSLINKLTEIYHCHDSNEEVKSIIINKFSNPSPCREIGDFLYEQVKANNRYSESCAHCLGKMLYYVLELNIVQYSDIKDKRHLTAMLDEGIHLGHLVGLYVRNQSDNILRFMYHKALMKNASLTIESGSAEIVYRDEKFVISLPETFNMDTFHNGIKMVHDALFNNYNREMQDNVSTSIALR